MPEKIIYLLRCHTGEIREAGTEVLDWDSRVIESLSASVGDKNFPFLSNPVYMEARNRLMIHPDRLSRTLRRGWRKAQASLEIMLLRADIMRYPETVDMRLGEFLDPVPRPDSKFEALNFLAGSKERIGYLMSPKGQRRFDTLRWGAYAYVETRVLSKAVNDGVFLTKPRTYFKLNLC